MILFFIHVIIYGKEMSLRGNDLSRSNIDDIALLTYTRFNMLETRFGQISKQSKRALSYLRHGIL